MKRLLVIAMILLLSLTMMIGTTSATSPEELTALARFAPEGTPIFGAMRTDDGFIDSLDALLSVFAEAGMDTDGMTVRDLLDFALMGSGDFEGGFDENVRSWLGDSAVAFMPSLDLMSGDLEGYIIIDVTDEDNAVALLETVLAEDLADGFYEMIDEDGVTTFAPSMFFGTAYMVGYDVMVMSMSGTFDSLVMPDADMLELTDNAEFSAFLDNLPADEYNAVIYANLNTIAEQALGLVGMMAMMQAEGEMPEIDYEAIAEALDMQLGFGFTVLNDRSLVIDGVMFPSAEFNEMQASFMGASEPVDLDVLNYVPEDAPLVVVGSGLGDSINGLFALLDELDTLIGEFGEMGMNMSGMDMGDMGELPSGLENRSLSDIGTFIQLAFEGTTGLDFTETLASMNGTYAIYNGVEVTEAMDTLVPIFDAGFVMFTDDADASATYVEAIADLVTSSFTRATFEDGVLTVPADALGLDAEGMPEADMIVTSNDDLLIAGLGDSVNALLSGDTTSLLDSDVYAYESSLFLADTETVFYFNLAPLAETIEALYAEMGMEDMDMMEGMDIEGVGNVADLLALIDVLDSGSITASSSDDVTIFRLTLTLSE